MQIGIQSISACIKYEKQKDVIFETDGDGNLDRIQRLICQTPDLFYIINKCGNPNVVHFAKQCVGFIQVCRKLMDKCCERHCSIKDLFESHDTGNKYTNETTFIDCLKKMCERVPDFCRTYVDKVRQEQKTELRMAMEFEDLDQMIGLFDKYLLNGETVTECGIPIHLYD